MALRLVTDDFEVCPSAAQLDRQTVLSEALEANRAALRVVDRKTPLDTMLSTVCGALERHGAQTIVDRGSN